MKKVTALRWKPNVTVAAIVEQDGKFLLVEEETSRGLMFNNPAGHMDEGESPSEACMRETLEETARNFTPTALVGVYLSRQKRVAIDEDITYLRFAFCGTVGEIIPGRRLDDGIVRTVWLSPDEIRACADRHRSPLVLKCLEDYLVGHRLPLESIHVHASLQRPILL